MPPKVARRGSRSKARKRALDILFESEARAEDPLEVAVQIFHVRGGRIRGERGWVADRFDDAAEEEGVARGRVERADRGAVGPGEEVDAPAADPAAGRPLLWGRHEEVADAEDGGVLRIREPVVLDLDLAALVGPRR